MADSEALQKTIEALEEANQSRREMAESLNNRNAHLERVIQQGEQSIEREKAELAKDAAEYTSSTIKGLSAAFGERFLKCYNEVQETKEQNAALKITNQLLEDQLENKKSALARSLQQETFLKSSIEEASTEHQALQAAERRSVSIIQQRDNTISRLEDSLQTSRQNYNATWDTLQEREAQRDNLADEVKLVHSQYQHLSNEFTDLTRTYKDVSSLQGLFGALAKCADHALGDGIESGDQVLVSHSSHLISVHTC
jgi:chromosome segregation ATPase